MGKRILMTGCSTGFGATVRRRLIEDGHAVIGWGLGGPDFEIDFSKNDCVFDEVARQGPFDVLLNNAGAMHLDAFSIHSYQDFEAVLRVNLLAPYALMRAFCQLADNIWQQYRIINTCSMAIKTPPRECPGYVASKAGLEALTRALARELAGGKLNFIFANIAPNAVEDTAMMNTGLARLQRERGMSSIQARAYMAGPAGRLIQHEEMYKVFKFAIEEMPAAMSGTTLWIPNACGA